MKGRRPSLEQSLSRTYNILIHLHTKQLIKISRRYNKMANYRTSHRVLISQVCLLILLIFQVTCSTALPNNIRIQVNNENLQSPPYLLEALRHVEAYEKADSANAATEMALAPTPTENMPMEDDEADELAEMQAAGSQEVPTTQIATQSDDLHSKVRQPAPAPVTTTTIRYRNSQLAVANSHLKRPVAAVSEPQEASLSRVSEIGGARTRVAPSVASDETPTISKLVRPAANKPQPPDTWDPNQIATSDYKNLTSIPAAITKNYGLGSSRTKITVGGGYVRDRQPPMVDSGGPDVMNDQDDQSSAPTKPLVPLENPSASVDETSASLEPGAPERILVPESMGLPVESEAKAKRQIETSPKPTVESRRDSRCPRKGRTTIEHPKECDKYFLCEEGRIQERTCPNGLLYSKGGDFVQDSCLHRWQVTCEEKSQPNPISSAGCRWQWGIFAVQGSPRCSPDYYECQAGVYEVKKCPIEGQVYDDRTKSCRYAELVDCTAEVLGDFKCPLDDQLNTYWPFPRYFLNERALIHCVADKPSIVRCPEGERVDPEHLHCVPLAKLSSDSDLVAKKSL